MGDWWQLVLAALGGGFAVKLIEIAYKEATSFRTERREARRLIERHLDPVLKAADEAVGKIRALAERDFTDFRELHTEPECVFLENRSLTGLFYILAVFWYRLELLRQESTYVELVTDKRGRLLKTFIDCLESERVRLVDRISQRAVGELMIQQVAGRTEPVPYVKIAEIYSLNPTARAWINLSLSMLGQAYSDKTIRQRIIVYGVILHAMIDALDPKHHATKERRPIPNKLSVKSRRDLKHRIFGVYVPGLKRPAKYYDIPKQK